MAAVGVEGEGDVGHARLTEGVGHFFDALAAASHRVFVAGKEQNGSMGVHIGDVFGVADKLKSPHHVAEHPHRGHKAAQRVCHIGVHHGGIPADPVGVGAIGLELPVVGPQGEGRDKTAAGIGPFQGADQGSGPFAEGNQGSALLPGA